jgi:hypothetical protein
MSSAEEKSSLISKAYIHRPSVCSNANSSSEQERSLRGNEST